MNQPTAQQLLLAAQDPAEAFGPKGISVVIAGRECHVRVDKDWWHVTHSGGIYNAPRAQMGFVLLCDTMAVYFEGGPL